MKSCTSGSATVLPREAPKLVAYLCLSTWLHKERLYQYLSTKTFRRAFSVRACVVLSQYDDPGPLHDASSCVGVVHLTNHNSSQHYC
ncbi:unnamed protein product [Amoebophrya sp. A25]|nr:unnamed protein product [Amoebophrya sp. A25]|eukprot:GSA25T00008792001.1